MGIIGYTFEADMHCVQCTRSRFSKAGGSYLDVKGVPLDARDSEGNLVRPFDSIEETQPFSCGTCRETIGN